MKKLITIIGAGLATYGIFGFKHTIDVMPLGNFTPFYYYDTLERWLITIGTTLIALGCLIRKKQ